MNSARRGIVRLLLACALPASARAARAAEWTLHDLMRLLARRREGRATFTETKTLALVDTPLQSSGELRFAAPDFVEMRTVKPRPQTLSLRGDVLGIDIDGRQRTARLQDQPEVAALVGGIRAALLGDADTLQRDWSVHLEGSARRWTLTLLPRAALSTVRSLRIDGEQDRLRVVELVQHNGDRSVLRIQEQP